MHGYTAAKTIQALYPKEGKTLILEARLALRLRLAVVQLNSNYLCTQHLMGEDVWILNLV